MVSTGFHLVSVSWCTGHRWQSLRLRWTSFRPEFDGSLDSVAGESHLINSFTNCKQPAFTYVYICFHDVLHDFQATCSFPIFGNFWQLVSLPAANRHLPFFQVFLRSQAAQSRETDLNNLGHALCGEHNHQNQWLWARLSFSSKKVFLAFEFTSTYTSLE